MSTESNAADAKRLLRHYLSMAVEAKGYRFDGDNKAEIDDIVDSIIAAAQPEPAAPTIDDSTAALNRIAASLESIANALRALTGD